MQSFSDSAKGVLDALFNSDDDEDTIADSSRISLFKPKSTPMAPVQEEEEDEEYSRWRRDVPSYDRSHVVQAWRHRLAYTDRDVQALVESERDFQAMKKALRERKCVTNVYLQQNLHNYVYNIKLKRINEYQRNIARRSSPLVQVSNAAA